MGVKTYFWNSVFGIVLVEVSNLDEIPWFKQKCRYHFWSLLSDWKFLKLEELKSFYFIRKIDVGKIVLIEFKIFLKFICVQKLLRVFYVDSF